MRLSSHENVLPAQKDIDNDVFDNCTVDNHSTTDDIQILDSSDEEIQVIETSSLADIGKKLHL